MSRPRFYYFHIGGGCCGDEVTALESSFYDWERLGIHPTDDPARANLLIVSTAVNLKLSHQIKKIYQLMEKPSYVVAAGACACGMGLFDSSTSTVNLDGLETVVPVDLRIAGCPPRPEALIDGILKLLPPKGESS